MSENNKIKSINSRVFIELNNLAYVTLNGNTCINENFLSKDRVAVLRKVVDKDCEVFDANQVATATNEVCLNQNLNLYEELKIKINIINQLVIQIETLNTALLDQEQDFYQNMSVV